MRSMIFVALLAGVGFTAQDTKDEAKKALDQLQGTWKLVSATRDGKDMPEETVKTFKSAINRDKLTIARDGKTVEEGKLNLDPTKTPKVIDIVFGDGSKTALGIYELDGDTFKVCYSKPAGDRPKEFSAKEGSGQTLSIWRREKK